MGSATPEQLETYENLMFPGRVKFLRFKFGIFDARSILIYMNLSNIKGFLNERETMFNVKYY